MSTIAGAGPSGQVAAGSATNGRRSKDHETIELLWTSGWDSTFRLLSALFLEGVSVRPHYIVDPLRPSVSAEQRAMAAIRDAVDEALPGASERLLPTLVSERDEIPPDPRITEMFADLAARGPSGSQYEWLSRYALWRALSGLELSIYHDDRANAYLN